MAPVAIVPRRQIPSISLTISSTPRFLSVKMLNHDAGETCLRKAIELKPDCEMALYNLAVLLLK